MVIVEFCEEEIVGHLMKKVDRGTFFQRGTSDGQWLERCRARRIGVLGNRLDDLHVRHGR